MYLKGLFFSHLYTNIILLEKTIYVSLKDVVIILLQICIEKSCTYNF